LNSEMSVRGRGSRGKRREEDIEREVERGRRKG
jgi:hypothetical protein